MHNVLLGLGMVGLIGVLAALMTLFVQNEAKRANGYHNGTDDEDPGGDNEHSGDLVFQALQLVQVRLIRLRIDRDMWKARAVMLGWKGEQGSELPAVPPPAAD